MGLAERSLSGPTRLTTDHDISAFCCGDIGVDTWLQNRALEAQGLGTATTFVVRDGARVAAYYSLSNASFERDELSTAKQRKGLPQRVPAILLGQLGVDQHYAGHGLGRALLRDAMGRVLMISTHTGVVVMHLHASTDHARDFYLNLNIGFLESKSNPRTLYIPVRTMEKALLPREGDSA